MRWASDPRGVIRGRELIFWCQRQGRGVNQEGKSYSWGVKRGNAIRAWTNVYTHTHTNTQHMHTHTHTHTHTPASQWEREGERAHARLCTGMRTSTWTHTHTHTRTHTHTQHMCARTYARTHTHTHTNTHTRAHTHTTHAHTHTHAHTRARTHRTHNSFHKDNISAGAIHLKAVTKIDQPTLHLQLQCHFFQFIHIHRVRRRVYYAHFFLVWLVHITFTIRRSVIF